MSVELKASIVRILKSDDSTAGTGFVVSDQGLIATCAHVIESAGARPGDCVTLLFHANSEAKTAKVEPNWWRDSDAEDVAVLRLDGPIPDGAEVLQLGSTTWTEGHRFSVSGYPKIGDYQGIIAQGFIDGLVITSSGRQMLQLRSSNLAQGHSGGPVLDLERRQVVGMVSEVVHPDPTTKHRDTALATPSETLHEVCRDIPILRIPLRELFARRAWGTILDRPRRFIIAHPAWAAISALLLLSMLAGSLLPIRAYLNRKWPAIPGGKVLLGKPDRSCSHSVEPFRIQISEVTNADYLKCVRDGGCAPPKSVWVIGPDGWIFPQGLDEHPVWGLRWDDADAYCRFIGGRLPTEAEWVRAARYGSAQPYPWGNVFTTEHANLFESDVGDTVPVSTYPDGRSRDGLHHLIGNVREWVADRAADPCVSSAGEDEHVAKGGSFQDSFENTSLWVRAQGDELLYAGVRCVRD